MPCNDSDAEDRDARATALAESLWPNRYVGDLTSFEWDRVYHLVDRASSDPLPGTRRCDGCEQDKPTVYSPPHDAHFCGSCAEANDVATSEEQR